MIKQNKDMFYDNLIAQAKSGSGKTGAFVIGSLLRIDPMITKLQVVVFGHTRELVNQISTAYKKAVKFAPQYKICNLLLDCNLEGAQVIITTLGKFKNYVAARNKLDLSNLRVVVLDEADEYFKEATSEKEIIDIALLFDKLP